MYPIKDLPIYTGKAQKQRKIGKNQKQDLSAHFKQIQQMKTGSQGKG
jgi:hypothetical protein